MKNTIQNLVEQIENLSFDCGQFVSAESKEQALDNIARAASELEDVISLIEGNEALLAVNFPAGKLK
jgi:hypothetical protein